MDWFRELGRRLLMLVRRGQFDTDLDEEMRLHRELREEEQIAGGLSAKEAHYAAHRRFGNDLLLREESRDMWGWNWLENLLQDIRYGLRQLRRIPGFTTVAVLTLALGTQKGGSFVLYSYPLYENLRDHTPEFRQLAAFKSNLSDLSVRRRGDSAAAEPYKGEYVSGNYFTMFGIRAFAGRLLAPPDDSSGAPRVAVMAYHTWQQHFGLDPYLIGSSFNINGIPFTI